MKWKSYVEKQNESTYVLPPGWDTRDKIADELECSTERVDEHLRPGLKSGAIEKQQFRVWDKTLKKIVIVVAYRSRPEADAAARASAKQSPWTTAEHERAVSMRAAGRSFGEIAKALGRSKSSVAHRLERAG